MFDALNDDQADGLGRFLTERFRAYASARQEWESIWRDCWERYILEFREEIDETEGKGGRSNDRYGLARRKVKIFVAFMYDQLFGQGKLPFDLNEILIIFCSLSSIKIAATKIPVRDRA